LLGFPRGGKKIVCWEKTLAAAGVRFRFPRVGLSFSLFRALRTNVDFPETRIPTQDNRSAERESIWRAPYFPLPNASKSHHRVQCCDRPFSNGQSHNHIPTELVKREFLLVVLPVSHLVLLCWPVVLAI